MASMVLCGIFETLGQTASVKNRKCVSLTFLSTCCSQAGYSRQVCMSIANILLVQNFTTYPISAELDNAHCLINMKMETSFKAL